jgi:uncharacterized protein YndB with AHSA1/START domain
VDGGRRDEADVSRAMKNRTTAERPSDRELVITRRFDAPAAAVFDAWTQPAQLKQWWVPKSFGASLKSCELDLRAGGRYRFEIGRAGAEESMAFFGKYLEATPPARLVWTNEESEHGAVTTVTFEDLGGRTLLVMRELYPSKQALDHAMPGMEGGMSEAFDQLDELLLTQPATS